jgi:hypothetical protein
VIKIKKNLLFLVRFYNNASTLAKNSLSFKKLKPLSMKSCCYSLLLLLIVSCSSNQSVSNNKQRNNSNVVNNNIDCSVQVKTYAENSYRLYGQIKGEPFRGRDGSYTVRFSKPNPLSSSQTISNSFQIWVDENCKVVNSKQLGTRFKI